MRLWQWIILIAIGITYILQLFGGSKEYPIDISYTAIELARGLRIYWSNHGELQEFANALYASDAKFKNKWVLVTGATRGLGNGIAAHFLALGANILLPCRNIPSDLKEKLIVDAEALQEQYGGVTPISPAQIQYVLMDLGDLDSIDSSIEKMESLLHGQKLDVVVNNAGLISPYVGTTKQGYETTFGVNFIGTAYFTMRLMNSGMLHSQSARIISVSSEDHRISPLLFTRDHPFGKVEGTGFLDVMERYAYSKLAQTTFFLGLAKRHHEYFIADICPGAVATEIARGVPLLSESAIILMSYIFQNRYVAALPIVRLATHPEPGFSGKHYHMAEMRFARSDAEDVINQENVKNYIEEILSSRGKL